MSRLKPLLNKVTESTPLDRSYSPFRKALDKYKSDPDVQYSGFNQGWTAAYRAFYRGSTAMSKYLSCLNSRQVDSLIKELNAAQSVYAGEDIVRQRAHSPEFLAKIT